MPSSASTGVLSISSLIILPKSSALALIEISRLRSASIALRVSCASSTNTRPFIPEVSTSPSRLEPKFKKSPLVSIIVFEEAFPI